MQIAVLIVCHNGRAYLRECVESVLASDDGPIDRRIVVVDNASTDGSAALLRGVFRQVDLLLSFENLGFCGGNNLGWAYIRRIWPNVDYVALLNQDTIVTSGWLRELASFLETHPLAASAPPKILLHPQTDKLNTAGNVSHFLGFGFTTGWNQTDAGQFDEIRPIGFASGAAMLLRAAPLREVGLLDDTYFAYLEDADLSWKLRQLGYQAWYIPKSVIYHKYQFKSDFSHYFLLERNRWLLILTYYKTPTLLLLLPALIAMEIGQLYFSWQHHVLPEKLRAWKFLLSPTNIGHLMNQRRATQRRRRITDRRFIESLTTELDFPELRSRILKWIGAPLLAAYWQAVSRLIFW
jgi:GT2 family glycosyltransferase